MYLLIIKCLLHRPKRLQERLTCVRSGISPLSIPTCCGFLKKEIKCKHTIPCQQALTLIEHTSNSNALCLQKKTTTLLHADVPIFPAVIPSPSQTHISHSSTLVKFILPTANQIGLSGHLLLPQRAASVNYRTHLIQMPDYPHTVFSEIHPLSKS